MTIKQIIFSITIVFSSLIGKSQELNVTVTVDAPSLTKNEMKTIKQLKISVEEFFNNTTWTEDDFEKEERIKASLNINIVDDPQTNSFVGNFSLQSERPVYNSSYNTILINLQDKNINFSYLPQQTIEKSLTSFYDHLSSVLSLYAYTILAYDYDSFSQFGGDVYFNKAQDVINSLPKSISDSKAWDIDGKNNKTILIHNMLDSRFRPYRQGFYEYHRIGLDNMYDDVEKSKAVLVSALNTMKDVNQAVPNSTALQMFADSKRKELIEIFKQSAKGQQKKVYNIMVRMDPSQANEYSILK